ncbi:MAG TPA: hypothetical protein VMH28_11850 [Candidatus Acidoferrales bacterium]|nr:hypothetical protein [Candidatus Acidoferrales bacterium]
MPAEKGSHVKIDAFTAKAVPDPKNPDTQLVTGFLGAAADADKTRIYWDASLSNYVDVATSDILHTQPLPESQSPLGGSYIWLKGSADVTFGSGGQTSKGKFFQGPLMAAYGGQFGAAAGAGAAAGPNIAYTVYCAPSPILCTKPIVCHLTFAACPSQVIICYNTPLCQLLSANCPVAPGTPVEGVGGGVEAQAAPAAIPSLVCSYAAGCWYSWGACPTQGACGIRHHPTVFQAQAAAAAEPAAIPIQSLACTWGPACWRTLGHGCGPLPTPHCPMAQPAAAAAVQMPGSYQQGCWHSWNACPSDFGAGCGGGHGTPACPRFEAAAVGGGAAPGTYQQGCWHSWNACPSDFGCGPHPTPHCPMAVGPAGYTFYPCYSGYLCQHSIGSCGHPCVR